MRRACTGAYFCLEDSNVNAVVPGYTKGLSCLQGELTSRQLHREPVSLQIVRLDEGYELVRIDLAGFDVLGENEALDNGVRIRE